MFWWSDDHRELYADAARWADSLREYSQQVMWTREYPWKVVADMADRGWLGAVIPAEYGGSAERLGGVASLTILAEELGRVFPATWPFTLTAFGGTHQLLEHGTDDQKRCWLPRIARGDSTGAVCITEPFTGSDAANIESTARRTGAGYVLNGKKRFISNVGAAGHYVFYARTGPADGKAGRRASLTAFLVDGDTPGISVERYHELGGYSYFRNGVIDFRDVEVGTDAVLGEPGGGWRVMTSGLNLERLLSAAGAIGNVREALRWAGTYTDRRIQFGQKIGEFQAIQTKLSEAIRRIRTNRTFIHATAARADRGDDTTLDATVAKLTAAKDCVQTSNDMVQCMGGDGLTRYYPVEQIAQDMIVKGIGAGSNEVLDGLVCRLARKHAADDLELDIRGHVPETVWTDRGNRPASVLDVLAAEYVANPGLHVRVDALTEKLDGRSVQDQLTELAADGDVAAWPSVEKAVLVRPTLQGLQKAHDASWYRHEPQSWVGDRERIG